MRVAIILCTYNGSDFIGQQLESLCSQSYAEFDLIVSDDGSTDTTVSQVNQYAADFGHRLIFVRHQRKTFCANFLETLARFLDDYDLFLFCDQDDVWLPEKIDLFVKARSANIHFDEVLIFSDYTTIPSGVVSRIEGSFEHIITRSYVPGNVMGISHCLAKEVVRTMDLDRDLAHDWHSLVVAVARRARIVKISTPLVLYRQHNAYTIGVGFRPRRIYRFFSLLFWGRYRRQIIHNLEIFAEFQESFPSGKKLDFLRRGHIRFIDKVKYILIKKSVTRGRFLDDLLLVIFMR